MRFFLALSISLLLIPTVIYALPFEFNLINPQLLYEDTRLEERIKAFQDSDNNWWLFYQDQNVHMVYIDKYNSNFVFQDSFSDVNLCADASNCSVSDAGFFVDPLTNEEYILLLTVEADSNPRMIIWKFDLDTETFSEVDQQGGTTSTYIRYPAIDVSGYDPVSVLKDPLILWNKGTAGGTLTAEPRYTDSNNLGLTLGGDGSFDIPISVHEYPDDVQVAYCGGHYHMVILNDSTNSLIDFSYDPTLYEYIGSPQGITAFNINPVFEIKANDYNLYVKEQDGIEELHIIMSDYTNELLIFEAWECIDDGSLSWIHEYEIDATDLDLFINSTQEQGGTDNLDDAKIDQNNPTVNYGSGTTLTLQNRDGQNERIYTKFNLTDVNALINDADDIVQAEYCMYLTTATAEVSNIYIHHVIEDNWNEGSITWNNQPCGTGFDNSTACDLTPEDSLSASVINNYYCWDITGLYEEHFGNSTISLALITDENNAGGNAEIYNSKEAGSNQPYLNVSYIDYEDVDIRRPYLTEDENSIFTIFYQLYKPSVGDWEVYYQKNLGDCSCDSETSQYPNDGWLPTDPAVCRYDKQKFTRECKPDTCIRNETYWDYTSLCAKKYNQSEGVYIQDYEYINEQSSCESDWLPIEETPSCFLTSIDIPVNCVNISVNAVAVAGYQGSDTDRGNFTLTSCTPNTNCEEREVSCDLISEGNESYVIKLDQTSYLGGDIANGKVTLQTDLACKKPNLFSRGVTQHKVAGSMVMTCEIPCQEEWICIDDRTSGLKRIDCTSLTNTSYCQYGCDEDTGRCTGIGSTEASDIAFGWLLNPSPTTKGIISLAGSLFIGILAFAFTKFKEMLVFVIGFACGWVLFTFIGWIPPILTVIILIFGGVGLYFKMSK